MFLALVLFEINWVQPGRKIPETGKRRFKNVEASSLYYLVVCKGEESTIHGFLTGNPYHSKHLNSYWGSCIIDDLYQEIQQKQHMTL